MSNKRVLIVDDDPMVRESLELILRLDGHALDCAANGAEALQRYGSAQYDLVLTDNRMNGMSGVELARHIKEQRPAQPVILYSGFPAIAGAKWCDLVLVKPFSATELRSAVMRLASAKTTAVDP